VTRFEETGTAVAHDGHGVAVRAVRFAPWRGTVFCASVPGSSPTPAGGAGRAEDQRRLVTILWKYLRAIEDRLGNGPRPPYNVAPPMRIVHDALGRPQLLSEERRSPSISFSEGGGRLWAALCGEGEVGIDVAGGDEFPGTYPLHRVCQEEELHHALRLAGGDPGNAAALLWSIKEAVAKALGCAFHGVEPRHITVYPGVGKGDGHTFPVALSGKTLRRLPPGADSLLWVRTSPQNDRWLSVAVFIGKHE
jgi:hypothetical protein